MTTGQTSTNDGYRWLAAAAGDTLATEPYYARSVDTVSTLRGYHLWRTRRKHIANTYRSCQRSEAAGVSE